MKILIVEDETAAYENLVEILRSIDSSIEVMGNTESVEQTVYWLATNRPSADLILMDINLSDGLAFSIFDRMDIDIPIIFTTAYDQYAIDAFKVNSVDYLLKPIKVDDLRRALEKFGRLSHSDLLHYLAQMSQLLPKVEYCDRILVAVNDKLLPVNVCDVACFYSSSKSTRIYMRDGSSVPYTKSLEQILSTLNPTDFIRANKQFIVSRSSVGDITIWFDNRLLIELDIDAPERIYVSKNRATEFKSWIVKGKF